jgi:hypothetical protein
MAAPTQVGDLLIFDTAGDATTDGVSVRTMVFRNASSSTGLFTVKDGDGTNTLFIINVRGNETVILPFGGNGFHFKNGIEVDSLVSASSVVYVFLTQL